MSSAKDRAETKGPQECDFSCLFSEVVERGGSRRLLMRDEHHGRLFEVTGRVIRCETITASYYVTR